MPAFPKPPLILSNELNRVLGDESLTIVDCRHQLQDPSAGKQSYLNGHIPGAVHASLDDDLARPPGATDGRHPLPAPAQFCETLRRLGISNDSSIVVYDDCGGAMAARLWWMLRWLNHEAIWVLNGGLQAWGAAGFPLQTGAVRQSTGSFSTTTVHASWIIATDELEHALEAGAVHLFDARAGARFDGITEPIDPVAGHIPGAINLPFTELLDESGGFLAPAELRQRFAASSREGSCSDIVAMCGSGVTACHLLLGMKAAGLADGRLYVGSWSEWIRDPARPVARKGD